MKKNESKSLTVVKKGIFKKIQDFFASIFKKQKVEVAGFSDEVNTFSDGVAENKKGEFIESIRLEKNAEIKELVHKIKSGEIRLSDKEDNELMDIEQRLIKYLKDLQKEVNEKREELNANERVLLNYRQKLESVN